MTFPETVTGSSFNPAEWNVDIIEPDRIQTSYHDDGAPAGSRQSPG